MKKLSKISDTPLPPPCSPPTQDEINLVLKQIPSNIVQHTGEQIQKSNVHSLDYHLAYTRQFILDLLNVSIKILSQEPNIVLLTAPNTTDSHSSPKELKITSPNIGVIGDLHGTFFSLQQALELKSDQYVFTGDYVDRGANSVEIIVTLLCLRLQDPLKYTLLRGNHETESISQSYSFYAEIFMKYEKPLEIFKEFVKLFQALPICAKIDTTLCLHGGISTQSLHKMNCLNRFKEPTTGSALANILWSDPVDHGTFTQNFQRGIGLLYGPGLVNPFCQSSNLDFIVRSHTCVDGIEIIGKVITVFSVAKYSEGNHGAYLQLCSNNEKSVVYYHKFLSEDKDAIDAQFFQSPPDIQHLNEKQLICAILCNLVETDYAFPDGQISALKALNGTVQLPKMSENRLGKLVMELEALCEEKEVSTLAAFGCFEEDVIAEILLVGELTLKERGFTVSEGVFQRCFTVEELEKIVQKVCFQGKIAKNKGKKIQK
ncbi:Serine/threonine-protein phosphatase [Spironucleus salmonicida]|uniref:Serine/threonine-protein phosphatase n=1 Tax=Spironucleus salmonicida TaxID=348837 RepID=V6M6Y8_9EUKA|nr:Serine/threonine-protein phosphatase [Spironucleus salmonicida]|eukprot:EST49169.1 Serine/threonine-protein phosphatase [Spironucleus salmonicida]